MPLIKAWFPDRLHKSRMLYYKQQQTELIFLFTQNSECYNLFTYCIVCKTNGEGDKIKECTVNSKHPVHQISGKSWLPMDMCLVPLFWWLEVSFQSCPGSAAVTASFQTPGGHQIWACRSTWWLRSQPAGPGWAGSPPSQRDLGFVLASRQTRSSPQLWESRRRKEGDTFRRQWKQVLWVCSPHLKVGIDKFFCLTDKDGLVW